MTTSPSPPWVRSPQVRELLAHSPIADKSPHPDRLLLALQNQLIRSQARTAHFKFKVQADRTLYNYPVPDWIWRLRGAALKVDEDRFLAVIDEFEQPAQLAEDTWNGLWKIELFELRFHKKELVRHFAIPPKDALPLPRLAALPNSKSAPRAQVVRWLKEAFAKDAEIQRTKAEFCKEARDHFDGALSVYRFGQIWSEVAAKHPGRTAKGRRPDAGKPK